MNSECPHIALKLCLVGESKFYKCLECKRNFTAERMQIKVTYPEPSGQTEGCPK